MKLKIGELLALGNRVEEFIDYFNTKELNKREKFELCELIIASFNDALVKNAITKTLISKFNLFLDKTKQDTHYSVIFDYWRCLKDSDHESFPVSKILQKRLNITKNN